jgi:hypothetical protein
LVFQVAVIQNLSRLRVAVAPEQLGQQVWTPAAETLLRPVLQLGAAVVVAACRWPLRMTAAANLRPALQWRADPQVHLEACQWGLRAVQQACLAGLPVAQPAPAWECSEVPRVECLESWVRREPEWLAVSPAAAFPAVHPMALAALLRPPRAQRTCPNGQKRTFGQQLSNATSESCR